MNAHATAGSLLDIARRMIDAAGYAAMITIDDSGDPSARAVAAFPPDEGFSRVVIATHPDSRKTAHLERNPRLALSYIDGPNRGYVTLIGNARIDADPQEKSTYWIDRFAAFWPEGPGSAEYLLVSLVPERIEFRSFALGVAEEPTRWSPVILERNDAGGWRVAQP